MKARRVVIGRYGGAEVLRLEETEVGPPGPWSMLIRVSASGVSFADVLMRAGAYPRWGYVPGVPFAPGWDVVGRVEALGDGVSSVVPGTRVVALPKVGGYAEAICVAEGDVVPVPEGVDDAEAVSLPLNYLTAYQMLRRVAQVSAGHSVLVDGAAGGVGSALVELARLVGARAFGTASRSKHDDVRRLGAHPIDYRTENVAQVVLKQTGGAGVDAAFDGIGGWHLVGTQRATRRGGLIVPYGLTGFVPDGRRRPLRVAAEMAGFGVALALALARGRRVATYSIATWKDRRPECFQEDMRLLLELLRKGDIRPRVAAQLPLAAAAEAHRMLERGDVRGRIVLTSEASGPDFSPQG